MTASERLRAKLELAYPALRQSAERIWRSPDLRDRYPAYLATMHGIVRSAVPLLEAARDRARELDDDVCALLAPYLARHAPEEAGHDVWLLEDLEALGADPVAAAARIPSPHVASLVGAQYYWLRHQHPVSILGHMAVVEGYPPQPGFADRLCELTGYPPEAFRALRRHEKLDIRHRRELYETIDALPLEPEHETLIGLSALHTVGAGVAVFEELARVRVEVAR